MSMQELVDYHEHEKKTLSNIIQRLIRADGKTVKRKTRKELVKNITVVRENTESILSQEILSLIEDEDKRAVGILKEAKKANIINNLKDQMVDEHYEYGDAVLDTFMKEYGKAFDSVLALGNRFSTERMFKRYLNMLDSDEDIAKDRLIDSLNDGFVTVTSKSTKKARKYDLGYYSSLLVSIIEPTIKSRVHIIRARENELDLLRVTTQPSKFGDYCEAFRGKVFSINGGNRRFARLTDLPTDCPPFHPFCQHHLEIYFEELVPEEERGLAEGLDKEFLNRNHDELMRQWRRKRVAAK